MENDVDLIGGKAVARRGAYQGAGVEPTVEVLDPATRPAHSVLVRIGPPVEQRDACADIDLARQAKFDEEIKGGVHRRHRDSG